MSPAEELRAAAKVLREKAKPLLEAKAEKDWEWSEFFTLHGADLGLIREDEEWIALASPALAEPIAAFLEKAAERRESAVAIAASVSDETETVTADDIDTLTPLALAVARAINGSTS